MKLEPRAGDEAARPHLMRRVFGGRMSFGHEEGFGGLRGSTLAWTYFHLAAAIAAIWALDGQRETALLVIASVWSVAVAFSIATHRLRVRRRLRELAQGEPERAEEEDP